MKKVLLTSAAVLALFAAAAPAVADINGGANTPGAYEQPTTCLLYTSTLVNQVRSVTVSLVHFFK